MIQLEAITCTSVFLTQILVALRMVWKWQRLDSFEARFCSPEASKQAGNVVPGVGW